jgi:DNA polymerase I-like protein with 3'-5' exonuclease and polymerase domains
VAEGQVMIDSIRAHAPKAYDYLSSKAQEATTQGYVIHNNRSGARRWFQSVLDHQHYGYPLTKANKTEVELAARNTCVQGTGSCIMKETIAKVALWRNLYKQDLWFVLSNYDEYVASVPEQDAERYYEIIKSIMIRTAKYYLTDIVDMEIDGKISKTW